MREPCYSPILHMGKLRSGNTSYQYYFIYLLHTDYVLNYSKSFLCILI